MAARKRAHEDEVCHAEHVDYAAVETAAHSLMRNGVVLV